MDFRQINRVETAMPAMLIFDDDAPPQSCEVRNLSQKGARLYIPAQVRLPAEFSLEIGHLGRRHKCRIRWRRSDALGVEFMELDVPAFADMGDVLDDGDSGLLEQIRDLEDENRKLMKMLLDMCRGAEHRHLVEGTPEPHHLAVRSKAI